MKAPLQPAKSFDAAPAQRVNKPKEAFMDNRPQAIAQQKLQEAANNSPWQVAQRAAVAAINESPRMLAQQQVVAQFQASPNRTGLPDKLKAGIENLSGHSLDDVQVHYNSAKPAQLQAHAYAQGTAIHLAPGQEKHLPHEAWHVVQQKQGRVKPTMQMKGMGVNDNIELEKEADMMGARAIQAKSSQAILISDRKPGHKKRNLSLDTNALSATIQAQWINDDKEDTYKWDTIINGVRWFYLKEESLMYYIIENPTKSNPKFVSHQGKNKAKTREDWVALYGSDPLKDEAAAISHLRERPFKQLSSGMDKRYFWNGGPIGWLETTESVIKSEFLAHTALSQLGVTLPRIYMHEKPRELINDKDEKIQANIGYWIDHIPMEKTYKPKMMKMGVLPAFNKVLKCLSPESRQNASQSLEKIIANLKGISTIVGELTIAVHQYTGQIYLLDFSPGLNQDGSNKEGGGEELAAQAGEGLAKIHKELG